MPDLVIIKYWLPFMGPCLGTIARRIKKNRHTTIISIADNIIPHEKRPGDSAFTRYFIKSVDGFITMSKSVTDDLLSFDPEKPNLFSPHPLYDNFGNRVEKETAREDLGLEKEGKYILFFGIIRDYKGLDILLKAMSDDSLKSQQIKLIVAGEFYTDPEPYRKIIAENDLDDNVIMSGDFVPDSEVYKYFCASDMVVQPYKSATQSGVTQIAYHFNKPMITTDVGGLAEIVPDEKVGFVVEPDTDAIRDAILRFYRESREDEFIQNILEEKKKYTWEKMVESINTLKQTIKSGKDGKTG
jgi:glycosyltransferase involved in cell wall biosynthesis